MSGLEPVGFSAATLRQLCDVGSDPPCLIAAVAGLVLAVGVI